MFPPRPGDEPGTVRASSTGRFSQLVDEARAASLEEVRDGDENRVFYRLSVPKKVLVMLGGPTMNLLIGVVLLTLLVTVHGVADAAAGRRRRLGLAVRRPRHRGRGDHVVHRPAEDTGRWRPASGPATASSPSPGSPSTTTERRRRADPAPRRPARRTSSSSVTARSSPSPPPRSATSCRCSTPTGLPVTAPDGTTRTTEAGFLGVSTVAPVAYVPQPVTVVPGMIWSGVSQTAQALVHVPAADGRRLAGGVRRGRARGRQPDVGRRRRTGRGRGQRGQVRLASSATRSATSSGSSCGLLAGLNFMLFLFNLIPLLPLDGGHVAGALWEGLKRQLASCPAAPTPATSTSPRRCPSPTRCRWCCSAPRCCSSTPTSSSP